MDLSSCGRYGLLTNMKRNFLILFSLLFAFSNVCEATFGYYSPLTVQTGQVPSTQTDFPILISVTDTRFKTVGNGGHVQNSNGFDIRPYSDSGLTAAITGYELERYNATTGEVVMWVKVASLSSSTTPIYLAYGDSGISTDGSSTATWSNSFVAVYHLKDGTTLSLNDSSPNGHTLTNTTVTATTGQIDGASGYITGNTSQYLSNASGNDPGTAFTLSAWVNGSAFNTYSAAISFAPTTTFALFVKSNGKLACYLQATGQVSYDGTGSHTLSTATWYYVTMTYSSSAGLVGYVNAASDGTASANGNSTTHGVINIGRDAVTISGRFWQGTIDEARTASVVRSANWITTEYNNQSAPGTFMTLGTEVSLLDHTNLFFNFLKP